MNMGPTPHPTKAGKEDDSGAARTLSDEPDNPNAPTGPAPGQPAPDKPSTGTVTSDLASELFRRADKLETKLNVASDNGLFIDQHVVSYEKILHELTKVFPICLKSSVSPDEYSKAITYLDTAQNNYDTAIQSVNRRKTILYVYAFPTLAYLLAILTVIVTATIWKAPNVSTSIPFLSIPKKIFAAGAVGALLQDIWYLWQRVSQREYRKIWTTLYALSPVLGALLGGVVYLALVTGILVSTGIGTFTSLTLPILLAIVAGYNWQWAIDTIENIAKSFQPKSSTTQQSQAK